MNYTNLYANVNSYEEALSYQLNIDSSILLLNSNKPEIYMKSKDRMGQSTIRCFKLEISAIWLFTESTYDGEIGS